MRNVLYKLIGALCLGVGSAHGEVLPEVEPFLMDYCVDCHDGGTKKGQLDLEAVIGAKLEDHWGIWEHALKRMEARQMPPPKKDRPSEVEYEKMISAIRSYLDAHATAKPDPGKVPAMRRLTRTEYQNAVRDLLNVKVDVTELLPKDESSHGFDNITVGSLSPTLLNRYVGAAQKIARVAVGEKQESPQMRVVRVPGDQTQVEHVDGLPLGTRGGVVFENTFPISGEYEFECLLTRDRNDEVEGLHGTHQMELLIDGESVANFEVKRSKGRDRTKIDTELKARIHVKGGTKMVGATFVKKPQSLLEIKRQPYDAQYNFHRHPRQSPALFQVTVTGPFGDQKTFL